MDFPGISMDSPGILVDLPGIVVNILLQSIGFPWNYSRYSWHTVHFLCIPLNLPAIEEDFSGITEHLLIPVDFQALVSIFSFIPVYFPSIAPNFSRILLQTIFLRLQ